MSRNKYPEKTVEKILYTSLQLFSMKGYDNTTIQDIVTALGMSKGAIYHHFKSKEEILYALGERFYENNGMFDKVRKRTDLNGLEKIRELFLMQLNNTDKANMDSITINVWKDPKFFMMDMKNNLQENTKYLLPFVEEGIQDGSIRKQDAKCVSEILLMLLNYWVLSPITGFESKDLKTKVHYLRELCDTLGIPIITDEVEQLACAYFDKLAQMQL